MHRRHPRPTDVIRAELKRLTEARFDATRQVEAIDRQMLRLVADLAAGIVPDVNAKP